MGVRFKEDKKSYSLFTFSLIKVVVTYSVGVLREKAKKEENFDCKEEDKRKWAKTYRDSVCVFREREAKVRGGVRGWVGEWG